ncbi:MAG: sensor histidine kinase [Anaerolineales bacterium]|nr:sensor histidine kinase [Anaerolineales bacterium]
MLRRDKSWNDAIGEVMAATVQRRDRDQSLGIILECSVQALGAYSGTLHLARAERSVYELAHAVNVERLDWLAALPAEDALTRLLGSSSKPVLLTGMQLAARWQALAAGSDGGVVATHLGKHALLVLGWTSARAAERQLPVVQAIQRYAELVMGEYAELEARAADIQALSASLNHYDRMTRTAAHDLSNKLTAAHSLLDLATASDEWDGEAADLVKQAMEQLSLSQPLVEEVGDPNRKLELERLPVEELTQLAAAMLARRRRERAVIFKLEVAPNIPAVWGERLAVLRILDNLIANSVNHNAQRSDLHIWLRVWAEGDRVLFEVGDNGIGISDEAMPQLFEFGFSTDSTGKVKGHGLGLWSSRRLVEAMGGEIWATSDPGLETCFYFALPAVAGRPELSGAALAEGRLAVSQPAT